jgi:Autotransporter beta-domain
VWGTNTFALAYGAKDVTDTQSELSLRTDKSFAMTDGVLTLRGHAAWAHDFDPDRSVAATFRALPGASFVVNGAVQARESALTTAWPKSTGSTAGPPLPPSKARSPASRAPTPARVWYGSVNRIQRRASGSRQMPFLLRVYPRDEHCQSAVGSAADPWRTPQDRHRYRTDQRGQHGQAKRPAIPKLEDVPSQRVLPRLCRPG